MTRSKEERGWDRRQWSLSALGGLSSATCGLWPGLARAQSASRLRVGQSVPLNGPFFPAFSELLQGQAAAVDEINARGGIDGRQLEIVQLDDGYQTERTVENARQMIERDRIVALFGLGSTAGVAACLPLAQEARVPLIGPYTGSPGLRVKPHPYFFTTFASYTDELTQMMRTLVETGRRRLAVAYMDNDFGRLMLPVVEKIALASGCAVVAAQALTLDGANSKAAAEALYGPRIDVIVLVAFGPPVVAFVRANRALQRAPAVYALSVAGARANLDALGEDSRGMAITHVIPSPWRLSARLMRDFNQAARRARIPVDYGTFFGYLNVRALAEMLRTAGPDATPASLAASLSRPARIDLGGYLLNYGAQNHHGSRFVEVAVVGPNGRFIR